MKLLRYILLIFPLLFLSCEEEEDFGFPSKIEISANGESVDIKGANDLPPFIQQIELLNYNGDGNNSGAFIDGKDCMEATTDWLTVKYYSAEYKLVVIAEPNKTNKKRKLYLYLYDGKSRQEITVVQSK
ncbi:MAG: BACON domain-containing carbohydrate-binding protein [Prevotella sp.]|nr:BACON domain-containing carbohydrate-binding protein [Prevotella sp.]MCX4294716.1 BACON domain-containing carbohydrate-binding protein [Prevotella sp.]